MVVVMLTNGSGAVSAADSAGNVYSSTLVQTDGSAGDTTEEHRRRNRGGDPAPAHTPRPQAAPAAQLQLRTDPPTPKTRRLEALPMSCMEL